MKRTLACILAVLLGSGAGITLADDAPPTFSSDVAKIVHARCTTCHRPGSSAPFSLITYDDVRRRAATIEAVLDEGYMPPWKPVDHGVAFANSRQLSEIEEQAIKRWIDAGCPEGDRSKTPAPPTFKDGWTLGKPDMVVRMNGRFQVPADGPDIYRSFVFPLDLPEDKWVKAVELRPRAKSAVHHAIFFLDTTGSARKLDGADGQAGIVGMGFLANFGNEARETTPSARGPLGFLRRGDRSEENERFRTINAAARGLGGYVPGATPNLLPGDLAMPLPKGSDIVMQTHFHPSGKPETEEAEIALYFADRKPSRDLMPIMVPAMFGFGEKIRIPAGEKDYLVSDSFVLPVETLAVGVSGHAHYVCREMKLTARLPDGRTGVLLHIDDWDLDWQDQYLFEKPLTLPAGTVLLSEIVYDNSADNPENPHHPPRPIRWGRGSTDEMGSMTLLTVARKPDEGAKLQAAVREHIVSTLVDRKGADLVAMLMQLDDDHDGKLQRSEAPPRMNSRAFGLLDANRDGGLDASELERLVQLRDRLPHRGGR